MATIRHAPSRSAAVWSSCTYAGRRASAATASSCATASARARRPAARERGARSTRRSPSTSPGSSGSCAKAAEPTPRPRPADAHRRAGAPRGARADLADRPVGGGGARRRVRAHHAARPARAAGARARRPARSASTGGSCSHRTTCSTTSSCTRSAISSSMNHGPAFWRARREAPPGVRASRRRGWTSTAGRSSPTGRRNRSLRKLGAWSAGRPSTATAR